MPYRQLLRLFTITAFLFLIHTSALHAQRARNTVLYSADNVATGEIVGNVTTDTGSYDGFRVLLSHAGSVVAEAMTGKDGTYSFKELAPARYNISYFKTGYRKKIITDVPVVENHTTHNDVILMILYNWYEERNPKIKAYEDMKQHKIEKMK